MSFEFIHINTHTHIWSLGEKGDFYHMVPSAALGTLASWAGGSHLRWLGADWEPLLLGALESPQARPAWGWGRRGAWIRGGPHRGEPSVVCPTSLANLRHLKPQHLDTGLGWALEPVNSGDVALGGPQRLLHQ